MAKVIVIGRKTIGLPLITAIQNMGHEVACSTDSRHVYEEKPGHSRVIRSIDMSCPSQERLIEALDQHCNRGVADPRTTARIAFLVIPSRDKGIQEREYVKYLRSRMLRVILFSKGLFAYHYEMFANDLPYIGRRAVVGGRTGILPWLRMHYLHRKPITLYGIWNASMNKFFTECGQGRSIGEAFRSVKTDGLAEPGAKDPVSFINGEVIDMQLKACAGFNDGIAGVSFLTPDDLGHPVLIGPNELRELTSPRRKLRPILRITNTPGQPLDFEPGSPGSFCRVVHGYEIAFGFCDVSGSDAISEWARAHSGAMNAVRVQDDSGIEGPLETAAIGAGPGPTIGSGLCDFRDFLHQTQKPGALADVEEIQ